MSEPVRVTKRELEVVAAYVRRGGMRDAGGQLGISGNTVRAYLTTVRRRLRARTTTQVVWLLREELEPLLDDVRIT